MKPIQTLTNPELPESIEKISVDVQASTIDVGRPEEQIDYKHEITTLLDKWIQEEQVRYKDQYIGSKLMFVKAHEPHSVIIVLLTELIKEIKQACSDDKDIVILEQLKKGMIETLSTLNTFKVEYDKNKPLACYIGLLSKIINDFKCFMKEY